MTFEGESCGDFCGWIAAAVAAVCYGSYGVPIKATLDVDVHPLVLQSYKTVVLFVMSWFPLLLGEEAKLTPYGIFSGLLWVVGGSFGILSIRSVGMAVAVGTWASVMVLVNFVWGLLVFQEPVQSFPHACAAFSLLICGLVGMSKYSSYSKQSTFVGNSIDIELVDGITNANQEHLKSRRLADADEQEPMLDQNEKEGREITDDDKNIFYGSTFGILWSKREVGVLYAVLNGIFAGSSMIPMHFAKAQGFMGRSYILSFGSGSLAANAIIWLGYFIHTYIKQQTNGGKLCSSYELMPRIYLKELWCKGLAAGLLLSIGMFGSIFAISYLGQGVGNSLVQSKILISGLWGIFWFGEVKEPAFVRKWFISAGICVSGILWLSYERNAAVSKS